MNISSTTQVPHGSAAVTKSPVAEALDNLRSSHERIAHQTERAHSKFGVVLVPSSPSKSVGPNNDAPSQGELADLLNAAASFMHYQAERLTDLNDRCAL